MGHSGTLDPFASGVLLILTGKATKKSIELTSLEKQYKAEIEFGIETDTYDIEGEIINRKKEVPNLDKCDIQNLLKLFVGEIEQIPPAFSAIKHKGKPLYKYARKGIPVDLEPRKVNIKNIELIDLNWPVINVDVTCSKGTYIRSLAHDLGQKAGTGAYLKSLVRTRIGSFHIKDSFEFSEFLKLREAVVTK